MFAAFRRLCLLRLFGPGCPFDRRFRRLGGLRDESRPRSANGIACIVGAAQLLDMDQEICKSARIVLGGVAPIPWRLPKVETMLAGQRITPELAARAGDAAVEGANPLAKNGYKIPLTRNVVRRTLLSVATQA